MFFSFPFLLSRVEMPGPPPPPTTVPAPPWELKALEGKLHFKDALAQSREFMGYYHTIGLTPEQERLFREIGKLEGEAPKRTTRGLWDRLREAMGA